MSEQADAVDADEVADAERRNPRVALDELEVGRRRVEAAPQQQRFREHQDRDDAARSGARARACCSSRPTTSSSRIAPAIGSATKVVSIGNGIKVNERFKS